MTSINEQPIPAARPVIGEDEIEAAVRVLRSGMVVQGPEVAAFERGVRRAGRRPALRRRQLGHLRAAAARCWRSDIGRGDEVIVPSFSFAASANAVRLVGAEPVFADIEAGQLLPRPGCRRRRDHPAHRRDHAGAPVRPPGRDGPLMPIAEQHELAVVEDAAQAHAAALQRHPGRRVRRRAAASASTRRRTCTPSRAAWSPPATPSWPAPCGCCATRAWSSGTPTRSSAPTCG